MEDQGYEIGYLIGSYLPFALIATAMIVVWVLAKKKQRRIERENRQ
jgi:Flp pilus assembly protein TadB